MKYFHEALEAQIMFSDPPVEVLSPSDLVDLHRATTAQLSEDADDVYTVAMRVTSCGRQDSLRL